MHTTTNLINSTYGSIWAILPAAIQNAITIFDEYDNERTVEAFLDHCASTEFRCTPLSARPRMPKVEGNIGVLPLTGIITQRSSGNGLMEMLFGGTKVDAFSAAFKQMIDTPAVGAVVLDIDSPGGSVFGINELGATIREARGTKPIIGVANSIAASAAYLIASAVDTLVVTPGGQVGSIGVYAQHEDFSGMAEQAGIKVTLLSAGKYKTEGNMFEPLSDSAREDMQQKVDNYYDQFISAVSKGRGVPAATVRSKFGQGRLVMADEALEAGMVDRVASFDTIIGELTRGANKQKNRNRAAVM